MTLKNLEELLSGTGLPVTYYAWPESKAPPLPYICYLVSNSDNFFADNKVYSKWNYVQIELYMRFKNEETEKKVEAVLAEIPWQKTEDYISEEKCFLITYEIIYEQEV